MTSPPRPAPQGTGSLTRRVALAFAGLLLLTVLGAWLLAAGLFLRPIASSLVLERSDTALYVAREVEQAPDPVGRARELAQELGIQIRPWNGERAGGLRLRRYWRQDRAVWLDQDERTTLFVPLQGVAEARGMVVTFPSDLRRPLLRVGIAFVVLGLAALGGSAFLARWVLRPLAVASGAMERVAAGALDHRVQEGQDAAGRMGATFNRMADQVESLVKGRRRLLAAASHELRTPLARMRLNLELLRDQGAPEDRILALEREVGEMDDLVGELLESSRLEEGVFTLRIQPLDLREVVEDALAAEDLADREVDLEGLPSLPMAADRDRLCRVFTNLFSNIRRYTPPGSAILVRGQAEGDRVRVEVLDQGSGVPPDLLPHLFDPFVSGARAPSPQGGLGTSSLGLGLMLVRQIVEAHGGRVEARNRETGGLAVVLDLPARGPATWGIAPPPQRT